MGLFEGTYRGSNGLDYDVTPRGIFRIVKVITRGVERDVLRPVDGAVVFSEEGKKVLYEYRGKEKRSLKLAELEEKFS